MGEIHGKCSGGFRGGTAGTCPPPLLKHLSINAPPFFVHVPPLLKPKKKKVSDSARLYPGCYLPPPPPPRRRWRSKKKCRSPPPPPLISFFGTCASFEAGGAAVRKKQYVVPPLSQIPGSAPGKWSLVYFHFFEALNDVFGWQYFQGFMKDTYTM